MTKSKVIRVLGGLALTFLSGCIVVGVDGWRSCGPTIWTEPATERLDIPATDLHALEVETHNGHLGFQGQPEGVNEAYLVATKKAGGWTPGNARAALEAIDVYVEPAGAGTYRIGWRWRGIRHGDWHADVSFDIRAPGHVRMKGSTHNGAIEVEGIAGDVEVVTHNGPVAVTSTGRKLECESHNGRIAASFAGAELTLLTHNGEVEADLLGCAALDGVITTHNGSVEVVVGHPMSASLTARTHNGTIDCDVPLQKGRYSRRELTGAIGSGDGRLDLTTHNGSIRIRQTTG